jgi:hypothetical protein
MSGLGAIAVTGAAIGLMPPAGGQPVPGLPSAGQPVAGRPAHHEYDGLPGIPVA